MVLLGRWLCERLLPFKKKRKSCTPVESLVDTRALSRSLSVENEWLLGRRFWLFAKLTGGTGTLWSYALPCARVLSALANALLLRLLGHIVLIEARSAVRGGVDGSVEKRVGGGTRLGVRYRVPPAPTPPTVKCCDSLSSSAAVISSCGAPTSPRFARVISLLSLAFLILPDDGLAGSDSVAVEGRLRVVCFCGDVRPSLVEGLDAEVEGMGGGGVSRVRFRVGAPRSIAGHKSPRYSSDKKAFRACGSST
jgi:hypothetical protein